eukprot:scaffold27044_cov204-Isochrysis_galbana.AAC.2
MKWSREALKKSLAYSSLSLEVRCRCCRFGAARRASAMARRAAAIRSALTPSDTESRRTAAMRSGPSDMPTRGGVRSRAVK